MKFISTEEEEAKRECNGNNRFNRRILNMKVNDFLHHFSSLSLSVILLYAVYESLFLLGIPFHITLDVCNMFAVYSIAVYD